MKLTVQKGGGVYAAQFSKSGLQENAILVVQPFLLSQALTLATPA
ncbi:MAG TPA: hypothetical protein VFU05_03290 [Cyclobacteriaceae bacterium]|nr:hypothetical protein [Cyclobacteriaceae bacterium]